MIGKTISHYKILEEVGGGGMGVIYKAEDVKLKRTVALKFLPPEWTRDPEAKARFVHEAQAASTLDHNNICTIYEIDETSDGQLFIAMALYEGETLTSKIDKGPLKIEEALHIVIDVANGLSKAHEKEIVHRDIKPANVMITTEGVVKILDFGLAKLGGRTLLTKEGTTVGTITYMSPEQGKSDPVDQRTDIWSLGVVLYQMVTGQLPFQGDYEQAVMYSIMNEEAEPITSLRSGIPMELERIVYKCLAKEPGSRYQDMSDLIVDFRNVLQDKQSERKVTKSHIKEKIEPTPPKKIKKLITPLAVAVGIVLAGLLLKPVLQNQTAISDTKPLAVMPFDNQTGDKNLDYLSAAIPNLLITNLERSEYLNVLTWERMRDLLKTSGKTDLAIVDMDEDTGFELCKMDGISGIVMGSFTKAGDVFATNIRVLDVHSKRMLKSANAQGKGVGSILESQIDDLSKAISQGIEIPPQEFKVTDVTTNSMDAYRHYLEGLKFYNIFLTIPSRQLMERAVQIDPSFAMAYFFLSRSNRQLGNTQATYTALENAKKYSVRATEKEALFINAEYAWLVEKDREKSIEIYEELADKYPNEKFAFYYLGSRYNAVEKTNEAIRALNRVVELDPNWGNAQNQLGYVYAFIGEYEKAQEHLEKYAALSPGMPNPFDSLTELFMMMGRLDDAIVNAELSVQINPGWFPGYINLAYIYALKEEYSEAMHQYDLHYSMFPQYSSIEKDPGIMVWGLRNRGLLNFHIGKYNEALRLFRQQIAIASAAGNELSKANAHELMAFVFAEKGDFETAKAELQESKQIRLKTNPQDSLNWKFAYNCILGFFAVKAKEINLAQRNLQIAKKTLDGIHFRGDDIYRYWLELLEGEIVLGNGDSKLAIQLLRQVVPPNPYFRNTRPRLYILPIYRDGLARAYYAAGEVENAISEYKRLISFDPESKERFWIDPKYHYRLGILFDERGNNELAAEEYEKFTDFWQDADENLPELIDAKKRLNQLKDLISL